MNFILAQSKSLTGLTFFGTQLIIALVTLSARHWQLGFRLLYECCYQFLLSKCAHNTSLCGQLIIVLVTLSARHRPNGFRLLYEYCYQWITWARNFCNWIGNLTRDIVCKLTDQLDSAADLTNTVTTTSLLNGMNFLAIRFLYSSNWLSCSWTCLRATKELDSDDFTTTVING